MIKCTGCGMGMRFDPTSQMLKCDSCGNKQTVVNQTLDNVSMSSGYTQDYEMAGNEQDASSEYYESTLYTCPNCGAEVMSDTDTAVTFCNFCGSSVMLEGRLVKMIPPSYVVPFKKTKESVQEEYKNFMKKALYAPKEMREEGTLEKIRGIYMPYWVYEFEANGEVTFPGKTSQRHGDYIYTKHYQLSCPTQAHYEGATFDASSTFLDELSDAISPFQMKDSKPFHAGYLSGFYADTADVQADVYEKEARQTVATDLGARLINGKQELKRFNADPNQSNVESLMQTKNRRMAYFPVWFLAVRHKDQVSYAVFNGQTGKMAADIPIDYKKYLIGSLLISLPIMLVLDFIITLPPMYMTFVAMIFSAISFFIASGEMNQIYTRQQNLNDLGLMSVNGVNPAVTSAMAQQQVQGKKKKAAGNTTLFGVIGFFLMLICCFVGVMNGNESMLFFGFFAMIAIPGFASIATSGNKNKAQVAKNVVYSQPFGEKMSVLWKPILAIVLSLILVIVNPWVDSIYYACDFAIMVLVLISLLDVVKLHNKLTRRIPRQFAKRGGDEL